MKIGLRNQYSLLFQTFPSQETLKSLTKVALCKDTIFRSSRFEGRPVYYLTKINFKIRHLFFETFETLKDYFSILFTCGSGVGCSVIGRSGLQDWSEEITTVRFWCWCRYEVFVESSGFRSFYVMSTTTVRLSKYWNVLKAGDDVFYLSINTHLFSPTPTPHPRPPPRLSTFRSKPEKKRFISVRGDFGLRVTTSVILII